MRLTQGLCTHLPGLASPLHFLQMDNPKGFQKHSIWRARLVVLTGKPHFKIITIHLCALWLDAPILHQNCNPSVSCSFPFLHEKWLVRQQGQLLLIVCTLWKFPFLTPNIEHLTSTWSCWYHATDFLQNWKQISSPVHTFDLLQTVHKYTDTHKHIGGAVSTGISEMEIIACTRGCCDSIGKSPQAVICVVYWHSVLGCRSKSSHSDVEKGCVPRVVSAQHHFH